MTMSPIPVEEEMVQRKSHKESSRSVETSSPGLTEMLRYTAGHLINGTIDDGAVESAMLVDAAEQIEQLQAIAKSLSEALLTARPLGGSEMFRKFGEIYYADPEYFKAQIEADRLRYHEAMKGKVRAEKKLSALGDTHVMVPREPSQEQLKAGGSYVASMVGDPYNSWSHFTTEAKATYKAMLAAAQPGDVPSTDFVGSLSTACLNPSSPSQGSGT